MDLRPRLRYRQRPPYRLLPHLGQYRRDPPLGRAQKQQHMPDLVIRGPRLRPEIPVIEPGARV